MEYWNEEWHSYRGEEWAETENYEFSNYGRVKSYKSNPKGVILKGSYVNGYVVLSVRLKTGNKKSFYLHKILAEIFLEKREDQTYVLHKDHCKDNNQLGNLMWANLEEKRVHYHSNPKMTKVWNTVWNSKLDEEKVRLIKRKIFDPNRKTRMKMLAKRFGISEMQLYRIKSGENWGHITDY